MHSARSAALLAMLCSGSISFSATVAVFFFETGVGEKDASIEATSAWEGGLMDAFFDSGHIVSNAGIERLADPGLPSSSRGLAAAREGGADLMAQVALDYGAAGSARRTPRSARYRLSDARGETLMEGELANLAATANSKEDAQNAQKLARMLIGRIARGR